MDASTRPTKAKASKRTRGQGKGYRLRWRNGKWNIEGRSDKIGKFSFTKPGTLSAQEAHQAAQDYIRNIAISEVEPLQKKLLKGITLHDVILHYGRYLSLFPKTKNASWENEWMMVSSFDRNAPEISKKEIGSIRRIDFERYIERRLKQGLEPGSVTRTLSPLRTMYRNARKTGLYGLVSHDVEIPNPFIGIDFPQDKSGREWVLKWEDDLKIFKAIEEQCTGAKRRLKWIALVQCALTTALRRGVLLNLKWEDIDWDNKLIKIKRSYWNEGKPAPPMVPLTENLTGVLKAWHHCLDEDDRRPRDKVFPNDRAVTWIRERHRLTLEAQARFNNDPRNIKKRINIGRSHPDRPAAIAGGNKWCDKGFARIIRRTDLFDEEKDGWLTFHDLRHNAVTRYRNKPYQLRPEQYDYLLGKYGHRYAHLNQVEFCDELREAIDAGDRKLWLMRGCNLLSPVDIALARNAFENLAEIGEIPQSGNGPMPSAEQWNEWRANATPITEDHPFAKWVDQLTALSEDQRIEYVMRLQEQLKRGK